MTRLKWVNVQIDGLKWQFYVQCHQHETAQNYMVKMITAMKDGKQISVTSGDLPFEEEE